MDQRYDAVHNHKYAETLHWKHKLLTESTWQQAQVQRTSQTTECTRLVYEHHNRLIQQSQPRLL